MTVSENTLSKARRLKLMAFDVDGVLTDGSLFYTDEGVEIKAFNVLDGLGMLMLKKSGIQVAIITGRKARCVEARMKDLGIDLLYQGVENKSETLQSLLDQLGLSAAEAGYMGDDVVDLGILSACGFSATPANGHPRVKPQVDFITELAGGKGAAREVCEFILAAQGKLDACLAPHLPVTRP